MKNYNINNIALTIAVSSLLAACGGNGGSTDSSTNTSNTPIFVPDETAPVITLNGSSTVSIVVNDNYQDTGAMANDAEEGSVLVNQTGSVDASTAGTYTIAYNAVDSAGNAAAEVTRTVTVIEGMRIPVPLTLYRVDYDLFEGFDFDKVVINESSVSAAGGEIVNNMLTFPPQEDLYYSFSASTWEARNLSNSGFELVELNTVGIVNGVRKLTIESVQDISGQLLVVGGNELDNDLPQGSSRYVIKTEFLEDLYSVYNKISFNGVVPQTLSEVLTGGCGDTNLIDTIDSEQLTDAILPCSQSGQTAGTLTASNTTTGAVVTNAGIWSIGKIPGSEIDALTIKFNPTYLRAESDQLTEHTIFAIKDGEVWTGEMTAQGSVDIDAYFNQTAVQDRILDGCFDEDASGRYIDCP